MPDVENECDERRMNGLKKKKLYLKMRKRSEEKQEENIPITQETSATSLGRCGVASSPLSLPPMFPRRLMVLFPSCTRSLFK
jgi:hypothetical protein